MANAQPPPVAQQPNAEANATNDEKRSDPNHKAIALLAYGHDDCIDSSEIGQRSRSS